MAHPRKSVHPYPCRLSIIQSSSLPSSTGSSSSYLSVAVTSLAVYICSAILSYYYRDHLTGSPRRSGPSASRGFYGLLRNPVARLSFHQQKPETRAIRHTHARVRGQRCKHADRKSKLGGYPARDPSHRECRPPIPSSATR